MAIAGGADAPASQAARISIREGQTTIGNLSDKLDQDWIKVEGLQNNRGYRLEVEFLGTDSTGGSFQLRSNLSASNWSGNAALDFSLPDAHAGNHWLKVSPADSINVFLRDDAGRRIIRDGQGVLDPKTVHVGDYVVTLTSIGHVEEMVSNLGQGYEDRYVHAIVGHRYSAGLDKGHGNDLGLFTDYAIDFQTGSHLEGYTLDRIEAQVQMGRTHISGNNAVISLTKRIVLSTEQLLVTEGDTNGSTYTVKLSVQPSENVTVTITGQSGTDLNVNPDTLTFTTSNWDTAQTVTITADGDTDNADDDITLEHIPSGAGFLVITRLAVKIDDDEHSAVAELPDAPEAQFQTHPRPFALLTSTPRATDATPVISIYKPYSQQDVLNDRLVASDRMKLCTLKSNAAYESGNAALERTLVDGGGRFTDVLYAGDCAGVTLKPNARYYLVFESYNEIPRTSILNSDDFYYVAKAQNVDEDSGAADGWSIGDNPRWRRYTTGENDLDAWQVLGNIRPLMLGVHATKVAVPDGTHGDWTLSTPGSGVTRSATTTATAAETTDVQYRLSATCSSNVLDVTLGVASGNDAGWPPHAATLQAADLFEVDGTTMRPPAVVVDGQVVKLSTELVERMMLHLVSKSPNTPQTDVTIVTTLYDNMDMETGVRTSVFSLNGAVEAVSAVRQACNTASTQLGTPEETETEELSLQSAAVDGSTLTLTYSATLDVGVTLSGSAFTVNGTERDVLVVGLSGSNVLLTLASAVAAGDTVTVDYAKPDGANVIKDTDGNEAESFTGQAVTNNTADPLQAPASLTVAHHESGKLSASWEAPASGPTPTGYTVQWKESTDSWDTAADVSEANATGTSHVITGLTGGTAYTVRVKARKGDDESDPSPEATATPQETVAPAPSSAAVSGAALTITFSEALDTGQTPDKSVFTVNVAGSSRGVETVALSGSVVTLTLVTAAFSGDAVTVDYMAPSDESAARITDLVGNAAASFTGQAVTNGTAAAAQLTATVSATPSAHSGSGTFTFEVRLSEEPYDGFSYTTMRDLTFTVTGGKVDKADRLNRPSNVGWRIHVRPAGNGAVTVVLPATTDCTAEGVICTNDRRPLSTRLEVTVAGPGG